MRQIGNALRVSHVLAGSVRKTGSWLHINAQLIDTRSDTHIWVEQYDRDLKDVFAIQSEIAQKVAEQLRDKNFTRGEISHPASTNGRSYRFRPLQPRQKSSSSRDKFYDRRKTKLFARD